jgi:hypothetical protein
VTRKDHSHASCLGLLRSALVSILVTVSLQRYLTLDRTYLIPRQPRDRFQDPSLVPIIILPRREAILFVLFFFSLSFHTAILPSPHHRLSTRAARATAEVSRPLPFIITYSRSGTLRASVFTHPDHYRFTPHTSYSSSMICSHYVPGNAAHIYTQHT